MGQMGAPDARGLPPPLRKKRADASSPPPLGAARQLCCAPAATRQQQPRRGGVQERHAIAACTHGTPSPTIARLPPLAPRVLCQQSNPNPCGTRISPQCLCVVLSTVQLSAHGVHLTPCTIRGRAGLSRRGAPLGQAGERATTTLDQCGARDGRGVPLQHLDRLLLLLLLLLMMMMMLMLMLMLMLLLRLRCCC